MGELVLVRHAQASFFGTDYDTLSPLGREQARALGRHLARSGERFDAVFVGPRRRHRETLMLAAEEAALHGGAWPEPTELELLDEHDGAAVMRHALGAEGLAETAVEPADPALKARILREFFVTYRRVMGEWARGLHAVPGIESWGEFRTRATRALDALCAAPGRVLAFSSGGLVSSAAGALLGLDDERVIELSAVLRNTALTEVRYSGARRSLVSFNTLPHIADPASATDV